MFGHNRKKSESLYPCNFLIHLINKFLSVGVLREHKDHINYQTILKKKLSFIYFCWCVVCLTPSWLILIGD